MNTKQSAMATHSAAVPESTAAVAIATGFFGAAGGAFTGAIGGPFGAIAGGVLGAVAGAMAGRRLVQKQQEDERDDELLDQEIGVIGGDLGAPQPRATARVNS